MIYASPDGALRALVLAVDVSLYATPDMESRVVIRTSKGDTVTSKDYSSPRGTNGYYVVNAKWSPDSQFFVYSMASSGGHSPWSFPMMVYSRQKKRIVEFSDIIEGKPTISAGFHFVGPHTLVATTWKAPGALDDKVPVTVDHQDAFGPTRRIREGKPALAAADIGDKGGGHSGYPTNNHLLANQSPHAQAGTRYFQA